MISFIVMHADVILLPYIHVSTSLQWGLCNDVKTCKVGIKNKKSCSAKNLFYILRKRGGDLEIDQVLGIWFFHTEYSRSVAWTWLKKRLRWVDWLSRIASPSAWCIHKNGSISKEQERHVKPWQSEEWARAKTAKTRTSPVKCEVTGDWQ